MLPPEDEDADPPNPLGHDGPTTPKEFLLGRPLSRLSDALGGLPTAVRQRIETELQTAALQSPLPEPTRNALGLVTEQPERDGSTLRFKYDAEGNVIAEQDTAGAWTQNAYSSWNLAPREIRLRHSKSRARTALCAACGDRVIQIYKDHWIGHYWEEPAEALDVAWAYAAGSDVEGARVELLEERLRDLAEYLAEEGVNILTAAVQVARCALESITDDVVESARAVERGLDGALWCAQIAESILHRSKPGPDLADDEETQWQTKAIDIAAASEGSVPRGSFDAAGPTPPEWWKKYQAGDRHL